VTTLSRIALKHSESLSRDIALDDKVPKYQSSERYARPDMPISGPVGPVDGLEATIVQHGFRESLWL